MNPIAKTLQAAALKLPQTEEGVACAGTSLEKRTIKARGKAFLFLGPGDVMFKLGPSLGEAKQLARAEPEHCKVGARDWVTVKFTAKVPVKTLLAWLAESYSLALPEAKVSASSAKKEKAPKS